MGKIVWKAATSMLGASLLLTAQPAMADGGVITAYVARKTVAFVVNFLSSASSNANAAAAATAVSEVGTDYDDDTDTGYFKATANASATSGTLASTSVTVVADYNFFEPNELTITPGASQIINPNGFSWEWYANARIKGIWQILVESLPSPFSIQPLSSPVMGELAVPMSFAFDLNPHTSYRFDLALEFDGGSTIELAQGSAGAGGASILFPYLEGSNPALASALRAQYMGAVSGQSGPVAVTLGQGLLPPSDDGATGLPVMVPIGEQFRLNSGLDGDGANAVPEPASWMLLIVGFGSVCLALRRRRRALPTTAC
jgi:hypothetical protein